MIEMVMGEGYLASHYFVTASRVRPFAASVRTGVSRHHHSLRPCQPACYRAHCPMTGVSTPISDIGALVAQNAELLAGIVLAQLVPGVPVIYGTATYAADMRPGHSSPVPPFQPY